MVKLKRLWSCLQHQVLLVEKLLSRILLEKWICKRNTTSNFFLKPDRFLDWILALIEKGNFSPIIVTQLPNSPDVNINDLGFFSSLKYEVSQICTHCTNRVEMMATVIHAFDEYPADKLEDKWACYYNNLRSIMSCLGGNDYKQARNEGKRHRRETGTSVDLSVSLADCDRCLAYLVE